jgi:phosphatidylglycerophosphate synthase
MTRALSLPNIVTVARAALVIAVVLLAYGHDWWTRMLAGLVALLIIGGDWLDGHLARKLHQATMLGSVLDIAADRMVEAVLWIVLSDLGAIPVWIPIVVISRGILTDTIRGYALRYGHAGFGARSMHRSRLGKFITGAPLMRAGYAILKAFCFGWLFLALAGQELSGRLDFIPAATWVIALRIGWWAAVLAAVVCLVRGVPVVVEGVALITAEDLES